MKSIGNDYIKASQTKRFVAYIIDWFIGALMLMLPISLYYLAMTNDIDNVSNVSINTIYTSFGVKTTLLVGLISLALGLSYYVLVPYFNNGQTIGKKILDLKIVDSNEQDVSFKTLVIRQVVVLMLVETYVFSVSHLFIYLLEVMTNSEIFKYYYFAGIIISLISCLLVTFTNKHLAIHDFLAKTKVVGVNSVNIDQRI